MKREIKRKLIHENKSKSQETQVLREGTENGCAVTRVLPGG